MDPNDKHFLLKMFAFSVAAWVVLGVAGYFVVRSLILVARG